MKKYVLLLFVIVSTASYSTAQENPVKKKNNFEYRANIEDNSDRYVLMRYQWKTSKEGTNELRVKFKNKTKSAVEVKAKLFFYNEGILEERAEINTCLKKGFWDNWFRPIHIVENENFSLNDDGTSKYSIEAPELELKIVNKCEKLHD